MTTTTDYASKCDILNDIWVNYSDYKFVETFIEMNDLGLPMAHFISNGIVESTPLAEQLVNQSFQELLELFDYEDEGFTSLSDFGSFA